MHHVFVDFENVHRLDLTGFVTSAVSFTLLVGAKQTKFDISLVEDLLKHAAEVQIIRLGSSGKNALDFSLAYYLGRAVLADPLACFHIISKDTGFDPLIEHLRSRSIRAQRHSDCSTLHSAPSPKAKTPAVKPSQPPAQKLAAPNDLLTRILVHLRKSNTNRPKRRKTLTSNLLSHGGKSATEATIAALIDDLIKSEHLTINEKGAVTYHL